LPQNTFKAGVDYALTDRITLGGDILYNGEQYLRGDEANQLPPINGFTLVNLRAAWRIADHFQAYVRLQNIFDHQYADFGVIGNPTTVLPQFTDPRLISPGAPRAGWIGVSFDL